MSLLRLARMQTEQMGRRHTWRGRKVAGLSWRNPLEKPPWSLRAENAQCHLCQVATVLGHALVPKDSPCCILWLAPLLQAASYRGKCDLCIPGLISSSSAPWVQPAECWYELLCTLQQREGSHFGDLWYVGLF